MTLCHPCLPADWQTCLDASPRVNVDSGVHRACVWLRTQSQWEASHYLNLQLYSDQTLLSKEMTSTNSWSITWDMNLPVSTVGVHYSSCFHPSQTPHPPTNYFQKKNQTREHKPAELLSLNCHQFILCSHISPTLPQLWKTFIPFTAASLFLSLPHPTIKER